MAQPRQQQPQQRRLTAAILVLLSLCCLARLGAATSAASTDRKEDGPATALDKAAGQEAARGFTVTTVEEQGRGRGRGPVRVVMEVDMEDYAGYGANGRHNPQAPHP